MSSGKESFEQTQFSGISVVIPARNAADVITAQLEALRRQTYDGDWEVIVADNGSTDATAAVVQRFADANFPQLRVVDASGRPGINHARNRGIREARGSAFLLCDADDQVHPDWLASMARALERGAMLVGGALVPVGQFARLREFGTDDRCTFGGFGFLEYPAGANCGARMEVLERIGDFDESYVGGGDETEWFWRAQLRGFQLVAVPDARVDYLTRSTADELAAQSRAYGASHPRLFGAFRSFGMPRSYGPRSILRTAVLALRAALQRSDESSAKYTEAKSLLIGRVRGSLAAKTWYV